MNRELYKRYLQLLSVLLVLLIFVFLGRTLWIHFEEIKAYRFSFNYFYLFLAFCFALLNLLSLAFIWRYIFNVISREKKAGLFQSFIIFIKSWFGKYLPGHIWTGVGKVYFGSRNHLSVKALGLSAVFELIISTISQIIIALFFLLLIFGQIFPSAYYLPFLALLILGSMVFLHPKILAWFINWLLKALKKKPIKKEEFLSYGIIFKILCFYLLPPLFIGLSFLFFVKSFAVLQGWQYIWLLGAFSAANPIGKLVFFAPGGIGVREGTLAFILQFAFAPVLATLMALVSRLWFILTDIIILAFALLFSKLTRERPLVHNS